jgi:ribonuclease P/MRP protein subunit RPP40
METWGHNYTIGGQALGTTEQERDIGVTISKTLKPSAQCTKAARTAGTVLSQISIAFHFRDRHVFKRLYTQYARPHLEFATPVWSPWTEGDKECLEQVQKRAMRIVRGLKSDRYEERLKEIGLTTLEERRHRLDMVQTYKILTGKENVKSDSWFQLASGAARATRLAADPWNIRP